MGNRDAFLGIFAPFQKKRTIIVFPLWRHLFCGKLVKEQPVRVRDWRRHGMSGSQRSFLLYLPQVTKAIHFTVFIFFLGPNPFHHITSCFQLRVRLIQHTLYTRRGRLLPLKLSQCPLDSHWLDADCCFRQLLLCRVTLGKSFLQFSAMKMAHAPPGHHSVIGRPSVGGLTFAEYVVYRGEQVRLRFAELWNVLA